MRDTFYGLIKKQGFLLLLLISAIVYFKTIPYPFQLDDKITIIDNYSINNFWEFLLNAKWLNPNSRSFSFAVFSFISDYFGKQPENFRLISLAIHLVNGMLVFLLLNRVIRLKQIENQSVFALVGTGIFLLHPLQNQSVIYISQQMAVWAGFFYLSSINIYLFLRSKPNKKVGIRLLLTVCLLLLFVFGIKAKQTVASLPLAILLLEVWLFRKVKNSKGVTVGISMFFAAGVAAYILIGHKTYEALGISRLDYLQTQFLVIPHYMRLFFLPYNFSIDHFYEIGPQLNNFKFWVGFVVIMVLISTIILSFKRTNLMGLGLGLLFIGLSIESSIFPIRDAMFEHRMYLPNLGFIIFLIGLINELKIKNQNSFLLLLPFFLALVSWKNTQNWKTEKSLWENALKVSPSSPRALSYNGLILMEEGKIDSAIYFFDLAIENEPNHYESLNNLGIIYMDKGQFKTAIHYLNKAIAINPKNAFAHNNIGVCWENQSALAQAINSYGRAIKIRPYFEDAINNQAVAYEKFGECDKAIFNYLRIEKINPSFKNLYYNLANCYLKNGNYLEAKKALKNSLKFDDENEDNLNNLGVSFYYLGARDSAVFYLKKALNTNPSRSDIAQNIQILTNN